MSAYFGIEYIESFQIVCLHSLLTLKSYSYWSLDNLWIHCFTDYAELHFNNNYFRLSFIIKHLNAESLHEAVQFFFDLQRCNFTLHPAPLISFSPSAMLFPILFLIWAFELESSFIFLLLKFRSISNSINSHFNC